MFSNLAKISACVALITIPLTAAANDVFVDEFQTPSGKSANFVLTPRTPKEADIRPAMPEALTNYFATAGLESNQRAANLKAPQARLLDGQTNCSIPRYQPVPGLPPQAEHRRAMWYIAMAGAACAENVPVQLFDALIIQESRYNPMALSPKGASGLAQLMPASARSLGVRNVWDPEANLRGGARLLRALLDQFGRYDLALAAYNAGTARVLAHGQVPRIPETLHYVSGILVTMRKQLVHANLLDP